MHKSKGNAIWFDERRGRIGADVMRWLFCATNPATNLNFGYGPGPRGGAASSCRCGTRTRSSSPTRGSTAGRPTGTDGAGGGPHPPGPMDPVPPRPLVGDVRDGTGRYDPHARRAGDRGLRRGALQLVRPPQPAPLLEGRADADKRAAYATLHRVLVDVTRLLAPILPHVADALWENLVVSVDANAPDSVHLSYYPEPRDGVRDAALEAAMDRARRVVALGRAARSASAVKTRQPLAAVRVQLPAGRRLWPTMRRSHRS